MSFGGYKFAGYGVDSSEYSNDGALNVCRYIHIARIRAFLDASNLAGRPWVLDPSWLNGELNCDDNYGEWDIHGTTNNDGNVHPLKDYRNNPRGYATYFRYSKNELKGYYCIMTCSDYGIGEVNTVGPDVLAFNPESCIRCADEYGNEYYGPSGASCFHCLSLEPFGGNEQQILNEGETYKYMLDNNQMATRITSIGLNVMTNGSVDNAGFAYEPNYKSLFGYCIKDADIISICGGNYSVGGEYDNPFASPDGNGNHVNIMSLRGLSELYNKNDIYKFLQLDIKNGARYDYTNDVCIDTNEICSSSPYLLGNANQVLNESGEPMIGTSYETNYKVYIPCDIRTFYNPVDTQSIPFSGLPILLRDEADYANDPPFTNSKQYFKGCTNPELVAMNFSSSELDNDWYTRVADGSLLYINSYCNSDQCYEPMKVDVPVIPQNSMIDIGPWINGYFNFYIGWDASNPDIRDLESWPEFDSHESIYTFNPEMEGYSLKYRTSLIDIGGCKYYIEVDSYYGDSNLDCTELSLYVDDNNNVLASISIDGSISSGVCGDAEGENSFHYSPSFHIYIGEDPLIMKFYNEDGLYFEYPIYFNGKHDIGPITLNATYVI